MGLLYYWPQGMKPDGTRTLTGIPFVASDDDPARGIISSALRRQLAEHPGSARAIYFLLRNSVVVYVGASANPHGRVIRHRSFSPKAFDSVLYLPIRRGGMVLRERRLINQLNPIYNRRWCKGPFVFDGLWSGTAAHDSLLPAIRNQMTILHPPALTGD